VTTYESVFVVGDAMLGGTDHPAVIEIHPMTGDRQWKTFACGPSGVCSVNPPLSEIESGPEFDPGASEPWSFGGTAPTKNITVSALPSWGVPLVIGLMIGVSLRPRTRPGANCAQQHLLARWPSVTGRRELITASVPAGSSDLPAARRPWPPKTEATWRSWRSHRRATSCPSSRSRVASLPPRVP
jgi:hypothetical protein